MSNFLLRDPDCVLIHVPKTGGTSIRKGAWEKRYEGPVFGHIPDAWGGLFKFGFVRHPLDRLISAWKMFDEGAVGDPEWSLPPDHRPVSLEEFFAIVTDDTVIFDERRSSFEERIRHHAIPQSHPFNCLQHADFVGRFETFAEDASLVFAKVGQTRPLPHMHSTTHLSWEAYLEGSLLAACCDYYRGDFATFGYNLPCN